MCPVINDTTYQEKIKKYSLCQNQRECFAQILYDSMTQDDNVWLLCCDVGYGIFDKHFRSFPRRCLNTGASEFSSLAMAVGLAMEKKLVFVYTITPFLLWRGAEVIRNYIHHEKIPVFLVGSGRGVEYVNDGYSHHCTEDIALMREIFYNIKTYRPEKKEEIPGMFQEMIGNNLPCYLSLSRF